ncbi:MAG TPA: hypothetical protein VK546_04190 [Gaiellales bacterium]|nr:hypothetical protein [Gaiellales bacterium]
MPAGNFDEKLNVTANGTVNAGGPLDASVTEVTELCVWVLQRNGANDAIANAMGMPDMAGMPSDLKVHDLGTPSAGWKFPLTNRFKPVDFRAGSATASAFGVFVDDKGRQRAFFWSEPVRLAGPGAPKR